MRDRSEALSHTARFHHPNLPTGGIRRSSHRACARLQTTPPWRTLNPRCQAEPIPWARSGPAWAPAPGGLGPHRALVGRPAHPGRSSGSTRSSISGPGSSIESAATIGGSAAAAPARNGVLMQGAADHRGQHQRDRRPPAGHRVPVHRGPLHGGRVPGAGGQVDGRRGGGDGVEQGGPDGRTDLLRGIGHRRGDTDITGFGLVGGRADTGHQRQSTYWVRNPPRMSPKAAPPTAMATEIPKARPRSRGSVKVVAKSERTDGASRAPNDPCWARAPDKHARGLGRPAEGGSGGKADDADDQGPLGPDEVADPTAEEQKATEPQRVGRHHPLAVGVGESEGPLRRGQGDDHDGDAEHHHQLVSGDDDQDPPVGLRRPSGRPVGHGRRLRETRRPLSWARSRRCSGRARCARSCSIR